MFCPRCGQQAAEDARFCSRCGLPLDAVGELLEAGGLPAARADEERAALTPRQKGMRKGGLMMAGGVVFFVLAALLTTFKEDFFVLLPFAALAFTIGLMRTLYGALLEDDRRRREKKDRSPARPAQLPHARTIPARGYTGADTSDMSTPASVAEATTSLLEERGEQYRER